jgi:hypothetical protein
MDLPKFMVCRTEYKGHANKEGVISVLKSDMNGMFERCAIHHGVPLQRCERCRYIVSHLLVCVQEVSKR